ncbi:heavy-metal-associated domain-containing protein [Mycobacterium sp. Y57]|uniref:heavy-metal-associated domain-containing protein n=1 Tax=Mycolicibacterium xanthum TaxID=2796469 RepID=UPI001C846CAE|nr:heavy metal-associated domain-containing protein [Mycolicibacterium xanthum]MBX7433621.1 heavy-metal-associated domain-containing protein [Mycolicibacterium xanthum]
MSTTTITVAGMSCEGCATAVRSELTHVAGVTGVDVDLSAGTVTIHRNDADAPVDPDAIRNAIEEAGYELAG